MSRRLLPRRRAVAFASSFAALFALTATSLPTPSVAQAAAKFPPLPLDGTRVVLDGIAGARFDTALTGGQWIDIRSDRDIALYDTGFDAAQIWGVPGDVDGSGGAFRIPVSGTYTFVAGPGQFRDGYIQASIIPDPQPVTVALGEDRQLDLVPGQAQFVFVNVRGGRRYRVSVSARTSLCRVSTFNEPPLPSRTVTTDGPGTAPANTQTSAPGAVRPTGANQLCASAGAPFTMVPLSDTTVQFSLRPLRREKANVMVREVASDRLAAPQGTQTLRLESEPMARVVVPFWGRAGERAMIGSVNAALVGQFGEPWVDRDGGSTTYLVPAEYQIDATPYVAWGGGERVESQSMLTSIGDDDVFAMNVGGSVTAKNRPWLRSIVPITFVAGRRYNLVAEGDNLRAIGFAVRDPNGRRTTTASSWTYDEPDGVPTDTPRRAATVIDARHGGRWAIEVDPRGPLVASVKLTVTETAGRTPYEPSIDVKDPIRPGQEVDIDLLPGEWARIPLRLDDAAQTVEPIVYRYRNRSFDLTASDVTIWDPEGRLVWSNNKDLEEEVFTGRLGKETKGTERFALLRPNTTYLAVVDPNGELAGRFRLAVKGAPQTEIVAVDLRTSPFELRASNQVGVLETNEPTRLRTSRSVCVRSSNLEWGERCFGSGEAFTLPPGVQLFAPSRAGATLDAVELSTVPLQEGARPPQVIALEAGSSTIAPSGPFTVRVRVEHPNALHGFFTDGTAPIVPAAVVDPRGVRSPHEPTSRGWFPPYAGEYLFEFAGGPGTGFERVHFSGPEDRIVRATVAANRTFEANLVPGQVLILTVTGMAKGQYVTLESRTAAVQVTNEEFANAPTRARRLWIRGQGEATLRLRTTRSRTLYPPLPSGPAVPTSPR